MLLIVELAFRRSCLGYVCHHLHISQPLEFSYALTEWRKLPHTGNKVINRAIVY